MLIWLKRRLICVIDKTQIDYVDMFLGLLLTNFSNAWWQKWLIDKNGEKNEKKYRNILERSHGPNSWKSLHVENSFIIISLFHPNKRHQLFIVRIIAFLWKYYSTHNNYMIIYPKQKEGIIGQNSSSWPASSNIIDLKLNIMQPSPASSQQRNITDLIFVEKKAAAQLFSCTGLMQKINFPQVRFGSRKMLWNIAN